MTQAGKYRAFRIVLDIFSLLAIALFIAIWPVWYKYFSTPGFVAKASVLLASKLSLLDFPAAVTGLMWLILRTAKVDGKPAVFDRRIQVALVMTPMILVFLYFILRNR